MKNHKGIHVELIKPPKPSEINHCTLVNEDNENFFVITSPRDNTYKYGYFFHLSNSRSGHNFVKNNIFSWVGHPENKPRRYYNLENYNPKRFSIDTKTVDLTKYPDLISIIQVRDLLNWYASLILFVNRKPHNPPDYIEFYFRTWCDIVKEYVGETNYLPNAIPLYYDDFFQSADYRKSICDQIKGAVYNEDVINKVTYGGGGSTFDKFSYQGRGSEMQVLERYKQVPEEYQHWWKVLAEHPEAIELYLKHFDVSAEKKKFINDIKYL